MNAGIGSRRNQPTSEEEWAHIWDAANFVANNKSMLAEAVELHKRHGPEVVKNAIDLHAEHGTHIKEVASLMSGLVSIKKVAPLAALFAVATWAIYNFAGGLLP